MVERARPLLGTYVAIRVSGLSEAHAHRAIDAAFETVAAVHRRMSFHDSMSDVSRLNREAVLRPVTVHPDTYAVLRWSLEIAAIAQGAFDITVARELVKWGLLPPPAGRPADASGTWRDIEVRGDGTVRFHRPVLIDLGGIAKGYAVDRAVERLTEAGAQQSCVNAGGDLRVSGPETERIHLRSPWRTARRMPVLTVENASVASSSSSIARCCGHGAFRGPHVRPALRRPVGTPRFVCVVADHCVVADALTKVVLVKGRKSAPCLHHYRAIAHVQSGRHGWSLFGAEV